MLKGPKRSFVLILVVLGVGLSVESRYKTYIRALRCLHFLLGTERSDKKKIAGNPQTKVYSGSLPAPIS